MTQVLVNALASAAILAPAAIAFTLLFALFRFANFAIGAFVTVGAFATWIANTALHLPIPAAAMVGAGATGLVVLATHRLVFQGLGHHASATLLLVSVALSLLIENLLRIAFGSQVRGFDVPLSRPIDLVVARLPPEQFGVVAAAFGAVLLVAAALSLTSWGRALRAVADNGDLAAVRGLPVTGVKALGLVVAGALLGLSGAFAGLDLAIEPGLGWAITVPAVAAAILGGLGSPVGAALGAVLVGFAEEITVLYAAPTYKAAVGFVIIALVLLMRPSGLLGATFDRR